MDPVQNRVAGRGNSDIRCRRNRHKITELVRNGCIAVGNRDDAGSAAGEEQLGCCIDANGQRVPRRDVDKACEEPGAARRTVALKHFRKVERRDARWAPFVIVRRKLKDRHRGCRPTRKRVCSL